jgi:hypothetical protein
MSKYNIGNVEEEEYLINEEEWMNKEKYK